jgi:RNA polymerase sigma-70 factor (ECF subfamily)
MRPNNAIPSDESDGAYARRVQTGNREAFRVLVERYERMVFDLAYQYADSPEDAEDLAQDIFVRAYHRIEDLRNPDRFSSWLYGIALNCCRDYAKNVRRETYAFSRTENQDDADALPDERPAQDEALIVEERSEQLWEALEELSSTYATPFLLKYRDGLTYKAMSKRLDVSVSALKVRVHRARKKLQTLLEDRHDERGS